MNQHLPFMFLLGPAVAAAVISYLLAPAAAALAVRVDAVDRPGPRKVHSQPVPRLGGLAVLCAFVLVAIPTFCVPQTARWLIPSRLGLGVGLGLLPIVAVSILDDIKSLRAGHKFLAHLLGAAIAVWLGNSLNSETHLFGHTIAIGILAVPLSLLWIVGATNAFNIVDGLDGLSAGLALISAVSLAAVFMIVGQTGMAAAVLVLAGAIAGFLPHNLHPAKMFLGDTGATAIGFCLSLFALRGGATLSAGFATLLPVFVLGMPIAETLISIARRLVRRLEQRSAGVFQADSNHIHHRLLALGIDHARAVLVLYGAGLLLAAGALASLFMTARDSALLVVALLLAGTLGLRRLGYDEFAVIRNGAALRMYEAPVLRTSMFVVVLDLVMVAIGAYAAVVLKTDDWNLQRYRTSVFGMVGILAPATVAVFWRMGLYRGSWRVAGVDDFVRAGAAVVVATATGFMARLLLAPADASVAMFTIYALVAVILFTGSRASYQVLAMTRWRARHAGAPALIYGAGRKGVSALRELASDSSDTLYPVAFLDDDPGKAGKLVNGLPVAGSFSSLERVVRQYAARTLVISSDAIPEVRVVQARELCDRLGLALIRMHITFDQCAEAAIPVWASGRTVGGRRGLGRSWSSGALASNVELLDDPRPAEDDFEPSGIVCPSCGSARMQRSHVRNLGERARKHLTHLRLHRCGHCGWRGWTEPAEAVVAPAAATAAERYVPVLESVDAALQ
jgi:UDP-GlcNAc:undecaprenyl-phosphate GlcNAc-1-phosphate transferase